MYFISDAKMADPEMAVAYASKLICRNCRAIHLFGEHREYWEDIFDHAIVIGKLGLASHPKINDDSIPTMSHEIANVNEMLFVMRWMDCNRNIGINSFYFIAFEGEAAFKLMQRVMDKAEKYFRESGDAGMAN